MKNLIATYLKYLSTHSSKVTGSTFRDQYQTFNKVKKLIDPSTTVDQVDLRLIEDIDLKLRMDGLAPNSVWKHHKNIRTMITYLHNDGIIPKNPYAFFKPRQYSGGKSYVTAEEISVLEEAELSGDMAVVRNTFLLAYYTLLRYSDIVRLTKKHIIYKEGKKFIRINTFKTGTLVIIPVGKRLEALLEDIPRYDKGVYELNKDIKKLFQTVGLTREVELLRHKNVDGHILKDFDLIPLYHTVTIHTARRSGITELIKAGVPSQKVMVFSGHTTETALMAYVGLDKEKVADDMYNHKFFQ